MSSKTKARKPKKKPRYKIEVNAADKYTVITSESDEPLETHGMIVRTDKPLLHSLVFNNKGTGAVSAIYTVTVRDLKKLAAYAEKRLAYFKKKHPCPAQAFFINMSPEISFFIKEKKAGRK